MISFPRSAQPATDPQRAWIAGIPFAAAIAAVFFVHRSVSGRLPDPLATHFRPDGRADGFSSVQGFLTGTLLALLVLGAGSVVLSLIRRTKPPTRWVIAAGWGIAVLLAWVTCLTLLGNARAAGADAVRLPIWQVAVPLGGAVLAGALGLLLAGRDADPSSTPTGAAPRLALGDREMAGWSRTVGSPLLWLLGLLMAVGGLVAGFLGTWLSGLVLVLGGMSVVALTSVRVTVDRRGLALASTLLPYPFRRIALDKVREATSRHIAPAAEFGGWGYRVRPGRSGLVLRSGEGLVLQLTSGREFVVTVDDAATAASLFNAYLDRSRSRQGG
ncbi:DUF1648 domain-containing protein [Streptomyces sp. NPDC017993]|uniref:DUF1648 domain-containing protein n=1 Tax=Streptomyces sp. NPDC017993 TaxID=3365027 RepID=UPI0037ADEB33